MTAINEVLDKARKTRIQPELTEYADLVALIKEHGWVALTAYQCALVARVEAAELEVKVVAARQRTTPTDDDLREVGVFAALYADAKDAHDHGKRVYLNRERLRVLAGQKAPCMLGWHCYRYQDTAYFAWPYVESMGFPYGNDWPPPVECPYHNLPKCKWHVSAAPVKESKGKLNK